MCYAIFMTPSNLRTNIPGSSGAVEMFWFAGGLGQTGAGWDEPSAWHLEFAEHMDCLDFWHKLVSRFVSHFRLQRRKDATKDTFLQVLASWKLACFPSCCWYTRIVADLILHCFLGRMGTGGLQVSHRLADTTSIEVQARCAAVSCVFWVVRFRGTWDTWEL